MARSSGGDDEERTNVDARRTRLGVGAKDLPPPPPLVGKTVLGRYRVEALLGKGAMGTVFRGVDTTQGREVALKVMHDHLVAEPKMVARFQREAKAAGRLRHPNLVSVI